MTSYAPSSPILEPRLRARPLRSISPCGSNSWSKKGEFMAGSILDSVMGMLGPQVVGPVASQLGESTETVQRGLQTGSAAMLAGLAAKVGQPGFMGQIFSLITNPANTSGALSGLTSNLG